MASPNAELIVFWDYASTYTSSASFGLSNYALVANIRSACLEYGVIKSFRAYGNFSGQVSSRSASARSELSSSGVTLADFPEDGQKEAGIKAMLVDIILHAWDHPDGKTYVIISNDRDIAYAVGVLRMRRYPVVVIASVTAHGDLTAQASVRLDWTKTVLGLEDGTSQSGDPTEFKHGLSQYPSSAFSLRPQQPENDVDRNSPSWYRKKSSSNIQQPPMEQMYANLVELDDLPAPRGRARSHSIFSYDQRNIEGFGALSETPMTPKMLNASSTLGDGPLFPRPRPFGEERTRAESLPHVAYTTSKLTKSVLPLFSEDETSSTNGWKGKGRDFPSHIAPPTTSQALADYGRLDFNPFVGENIMHFPSTPPLPPSVPRGDTTQGHLTSSSSTSSRSSKFSAVHHSENTAITSVATVTDKNAYGLDGAGGTDPASLDTANVVEMPVYAAPPAETSTLSADSDVTAKAEKATSPIAPPIPLLAASNEIFGASASTPEPFKFQFKAPPPVPESAPVASSSHHPIPPAAGKPPPKAAPAKVPKPSQPTQPPQTTKTPNNLSAKKKYQHLISTLQELRKVHGNKVPKSVVGDSLSKIHPPGYTKFRSYIDNAVAAGVISQKQDSVSLTPAYAA